MASKYTQEEEIAEEDNVQQETQDRDEVNLRYSDPETDVSASDGESESDAEVKMKMDGFQAGTLSEADLSVSEVEIDYLQEDAIAKPGGLGGKIWHGDVRGAFQQLRKGYHKFTHSERGGCYYDFKARKELPGDQKSAFRVALKYLQVLAMHNKITRTDDYAYFLERLEKHAVHIAVIGRHGVGKSTLINGLLGDDILPMHRRNESAVRVFIIYCEDIPKGIELDHKCGNGPKKTVAWGKKDVSDWICSKNEEVRCNKTEEEKTQQYKKDERLILRLKMSTLKSESGSQVMLVDTPGFFEATRSHLEAAARKVMRASAAYLLLVPYDQMGNKGDLSILKQLTELDKGVISGGRLVIAVTKYDAYFADNNETEMDRKQTSEYIHMYLKECNHDLKSDRIIPVSGKWALAARRLRENPGDAILLKAAKKYLSEFKEVTVPCGEDQTRDRDFRKEVEALKTDDIAEQLEEASHVKDLESEIRSVTLQCDSIFEDDAKSKIGGFLRKAVDELQRKWKGVNDEFLAKRNEMAAVNNQLLCIREREAELNRTIGGEDESMKANLRQSYKTEAKKPYDEVKKLIDKMLNECKSTCLVECRSAQENPQQYSTAQLNKAIETFVLGKIEDAVMPVVKSGCIERTRNAWHVYVLTYVLEQFKKMQQAVHNLPSISGDFANAWKIPGMAVDTVLQEVNKDLFLGDLLQKHKMDVPAVLDYTWRQRIKVMLRAVFRCQKPGDPDTLKEAWEASGPKADNIPLQEVEIVEGFDKLKHSLLERCDEYFFTDAGIQKIVVDCFYEEYTNWVKTGLHDFNGRFGAKIAEEEASLKQMDHEIKEQEKERSDLDYFGKDLKDLLAGTWF